MMVSFNSFQKILNNIFILNAVGFRRKIQYIYVYLMHNTCAKKLEYLYIYSMLAK